MKLDGTKQQRLYCKRRWFCALLLLQWTKASARKKFDIVWEQYTIHTHTRAHTMGCIDRERHEAAHEVEEWESESFIGILLFELCIYGITFWFIWNVYRSLFAHSMFASHIHSLFVVMLCAGVWFSRGEEGVAVSECVCVFFLRLPIYLYLILQQMYTAVKEAWCANAIKMAKTQHLLYRHDLLFASSSLSGLNPHLVYALF